MAKKTVKVAIVGMGTVGTGVAQMLRRNHETICRRSGTHIELTRVCDRFPRRKRDITLPKGLMTSDLSKVLDDPEIDIVVELIGGTGPAKTVVTEALKRGKHVATANKALLAENWNELLALAHRHGRAIQFEASVMSGVPVIRALNEGLAGNTVQSMLGVLNGTTNTILTAIDRDGMDYADALRQAQAEGFAESDPTFDVEGADAAYKLSILGSLATGQWLPPKRIPCEGITNLLTKDIKYARELYGYHPKLLAVFKQQRDRVEARVHPAFVHTSHPLASVVDGYNALYVTAEPVGSVMFYGLGAGAMAAASGVVSDIVHLARMVKNGVEGDILATIRPAKRAVALAPVGEAESNYYIRFTTVDRPGVLAAIAGAFGKEGVSIESVYQAAGDPKTGADIVIITHLAQDGAVRRACRRAARLRRIMRGAPAVIRIEKG